MAIIRLLLLLVIASFPAFADSDREEIAQVMADFQQWDHLGGVERAKKSLAKTVRYNYVDKEGKHVSYTVDFAYQGKGKAAYKPYIVALDIYGNMAVVKAIHHYNNEQAYLKAFVLHKLAQGWQITNVSWGQITPDK